jgi:hypothetical protein
MTDNKIEKYADSWAEDKKSQVSDVLPNVGLWSEILPNLWQGGTHYKDRIGMPVSEPAITIKEFDSVYTAYAFANPVDWFVREIRFAFLDSDDVDFDLDELRFIVESAYNDWKNDKRVLIRCQAGLNRSSIITALVLIKDGYTAVDAINLIRDKRSDVALFNPAFEQWLLLNDPHEWLTDSK